MMQKEAYISRKQPLFAVIIILLMVFATWNTVGAQDSVIDDLQDEISQHESQIDQLNRRMDEYREQISHYASESATLQSDVEMIENQIALAELSVESTQVQISEQELTVQLLEERIRQKTEELNMQRELLAEMLFQMQKEGDVSWVETIFGSSDFHELFSGIEYLESLNNGLRQTVDETKSTRLTLEEDKAQQQQYLDSLIALQVDLEQQLDDLERQQTAKDVLIDAAENSEAQYRVLLSELRQEQQYLTQQIAALQADIEAQLSEADQSGDASVMNWPTLNGWISATYHDPTYPYRHLFEHSGIDIAVYTGTPIHAAAPGIVAWARTGRSYGNYVMIIHEGGLSTLYAHLSRLDVVADQYVARGQQIGLSGNTGLSTGPHLHFETRLNGIPVNPMNYLIAR